MKSKDERQLIGVEAWRSNKGIGIWQWPTGMGKTYSVLTHLVTKLFAARGPQKTIISVPTTDLKNAWNYAIQARFPELQEYFTVETVSYMVMNRIVDRCTLLVVDEIDEFYSKNRQKLWDGSAIEYKYFLGLSATPLDPQERHVEILKRIPIVDTITKKEAIDNGWIEDTLIFNLEAELTEEEQEQYDELTETIQHNLSFFEGDLGTALNCLNDFSKATQVAIRGGWTRELNNIATRPKPLEMSREQFEEILLKVAMWNPNTIIGYAKNALTAINQRKDLAAACKAKLKCAVDIAKRFHNDKIMYFNEKVGPANHIYKEIHDNTNRQAVIYHSQLESRPLRYDSITNEPSLFGKGDWVTIKTKRSKNYGKKKIFGKKVLQELAIEWIKSVETGIIVSGTGLDKGFDVPDMTMGIINSFTSVSNQYIQRIGRLTRLHQIKNTMKPIVVVLYIKGTSEEYKLYKLQEDQQVYWIRSIEEISRTPDSTVKLNIGI
jgi:superfamily II DNA or RNA helicase